MDIHQIRTKDVRTKEEVEVLSEVVFRKTDGLEVDGTGRIDDNGFRHSEEARESIEEAKDDGRQTKGMSCLSSATTLYLLYAGGCSSVRAP